MYQADAPIRELFRKLRLINYQANGLVGPHVYSIIGAFTVYEYGIIPVKLLKLWDPHGHGKWKGDWSDPPADDGYCYFGSRWNNLSEEEERALRGKNRDDGDFFMAWEDIPVYFTRIDIVNLVRESEIKAPDAIASLSVYHGEWNIANKTAGGLSKLCSRGEAMNMTHLL